MARIQSEFDAQLGEFTACWPLEQRRLLSKDHSAVSQQIDVPGIFFGTHDPVACRLMLVPLVPGTQNEGIAFRHTREGYIKLKCEKELDQKGTPKVCVTLAVARDRKTALDRNTSMPHDFSRKCSCQLRYSSNDLAFLDSESRSFVAAVKIVLPPGSCNGTSHDLLGVPGLLAVDPPPLDPSEQDAYAGSTQQYVGPSRDLEVPMECAEEKPKDEPDVARELEIAETKVASDEAEDVPKRWADYSDNEETEEEDDDLLHCTSFDAFHLHLQCSKPEQKSYHPKQK